MPNDNRTKSVVSTAGVYEHAQPQRVLIRSGPADVKTNGSLSPWFTHNWLFLTEDALLLFKDNTMCTKRPVHTIRHRDIASIARLEGSNRAFCLQLKTTHRVFLFAFKSDVELNLWRRDLLLLHRPVLVISRHVSGFDNDASQAGNDAGPSDPKGKGKEILRSIKSKGTFISDISEPTTTSSFTRFFRTRSSLTSRTSHNSLNSLLTPTESLFEYRDRGTACDDPSPTNLPHVGTGLGLLDFEHSQFNDAYLYPPVVDTVSAEPLDLSGKVNRIDEYPVASGGYADVWRGEWKADGCSRLVAIKVVRVFSADENNDRKVEKRLMHEADVWHRLHHPHITELWGTANGFGRYTSLVSPWMKNGNASSFFEGTDPQTSSPQRLKLLLEVALALEYLHSFTPKVLHGDLKAANILINDAGEASLCDFGLSSVLEDAVGVSHFTLSSRVGSVRWLAFEMLSGAERDESPALTTWCDIWSFGSVVYEVLSGKLPYHHRKNDIQVMYEIMGGLRPRYAGSNIPMNVWSFLQHCWADEPTARPDIREVVRVMRGFGGKDDNRRTDTSKPPSSGPTGTSGTRNKRRLPIRDLEKPGDKGGQSLTKGEMERPRILRTSSWKPLGLPGLPGLPELPEPAR